MHYLKQLTLTLFGSEDVLFNEKGVKINGMVRNKFIGMWMFLTINILKR